MLIRFKTMEPYTFFEKHCPNNKNNTFMGSISWDQLLTKKKLDIQQKLSAKSNVRALTDKQLEQQTST